MRKGRGNCVGFLRGVGSSVENTPAVFVRPWSCVVVIVQGARHHDMARHSVRVAAFIVAIWCSSQTACMNKVPGAYRTTAFNTAQCYWTWNNDIYGGYEQMYCWDPVHGGYLPYVYAGVPVRRYPQWYSGTRVVTTPPPVVLVRPPGVVVVPAPATEITLPQPARPRPAWHAPSIVVPVRSAPAESIH